MDSTEDAVSSPDRVGERMIPETAMIEALHISPKLSCDNRIEILREAHRLAALPTTPPAADAGEVERLREALEELLPYVEAARLREEAQAALREIIRMPVRQAVKKARAALAPRDHGEAGKQLSPTLDPRGIQCGVCREWFETTSAGYCASCIKGHKVPAR